MLMGALRGSCGRRIQQCSYLEWRRHVKCRDRCILLLGCFNDICGTGATLLDVGDNTATAAAAAPA